jgi:hypothetical protein
VPPFTITTSRVRNLHGAIAFDVTPAAQIWNLRDTLRSATLAAYPVASVKPTSSNPHITIAYPARDDRPAADADAVVQRINAKVRPVEVTVSEVVMVLLERQERGYAWELMTRIPLDG